MKYKFRIAILVFALLLPMTLLCACNNNKNGFSIIGKWEGNNVNTVSTNISCEEYETIDGVYIGKRLNYVSHIYLVDGISKDLTLAYNGLVEKSTNLYLGKDYTYTYKLRDNTTNEILYSSEEVNYYEHNACFDKTTLKFIGLCSSSYEESYGVYAYIVDGKKYTSEEVGCYDNSYFSKETNLFLGTRHNKFDEIRTYYVNDKYFEADEVYELIGMSGGFHEDWFSGKYGYCYIEKDTLYCYKIDDVVSTSGYEYDAGVYVNSQVKQIQRNCIGQEQTLLTVDFGENFAILKIATQIIYDYSEIIDYTFKDQNTSKTIFYRGYYGSINEVVYMEADQYSYDGIQWYNLNNQYPKKFEFQISDNGLQFSDKSNALPLYQDMFLLKQN